MGIAGHVSKKALQHYSHVRIEAKRNALGRPLYEADSVGTLEGYDTNNNTKLRGKIE